jgi:hypothetical protein
MLLTGFERLQDNDDTDDVYDFQDLDNIFGDLTLIDGTVDDLDTVKVGDDALDFWSNAEINDYYDDNGGNVDEDTVISLEMINDYFAFDFDVLDITNVTDNDLVIFGDDDDQDDDGTENDADNDYDDVSDSGLADADEDGAADVDRDNGEDDGDALIVGDLGLIDSLGFEGEDDANFDAIWFTDASVADGAEFTLDTSDVDYVLEDGSGDELFTIYGAMTGQDLDELNFSLVTEDVTVEIEGNDGMTVVGGSGDDALTGGGGDDDLMGGAGADVLNGGLTTEVRQLQVAGILDATVDAAAVTLEMGNGGVVLTINESAAPADVDATDEDLDILAGAGSDAVGAALAALVMANLADINGVANAFEDAAGNDIDLVSATYDAASDLLTFTFAPGADVDDTDDIVGTSGDTGASFAISSQDVVSDGSDGGADTFSYSSIGDAGDTIENFLTGDDVIRIVVDSALAADLDDEGDEAGQDDSGTAIDWQSSIVDDATEGVWVDSGDSNLTVAELEDLADVAALLDDLFGGDGDLDEQGDDLIFAVENEDGGTYGLYFFVDDGDADIEATELTLIAVVEADDLDVSDIVIS